MRSILFVDDEPQVLDGLRNMLRKQRKHWQMTFVDSGGAALTHLAGQPCDVIVTDLRMPGMDGAHLLQQVRQRHPEMIRLALSGQAGMELLQRASPLVHQLLDKPCDGDELCAYIERACALQPLLHDPGVRAIIASLTGWPSLPGSYWELLQQLGQPGEERAGQFASLAEGSGVAQRVRLLLQASGSAVPDAGLEEMAGTLSLPLLKGALLMAYLCRLVDESAAPGKLDASGLLEASLLTARVCKQFLAGAEAAEQAFSAALLHEIGKVVIALGAPEHYAAIRAQAASSGRSAHEVEFQCLGASHAEVGACMLALWGMPLPIVEAVALHHRPQAQVYGGHELLGALHVADVLVDEYLAGGRGETSLHLEYLEQAGLGEHLPRWRQLAGAELARNARGGGEAA